MFTFDDNQFNEITDRIKDDLGEDLVDRLREEVIKIKSQYAVKLADQIEYYSDDKVVGSKTFAPHIVNEGLTPGTFPNFDRLKEWVKTVKDGGKNLNLPEYVLNKITYRVAKKIQREGIKPSWFVDRVLSKLESENP